MNCPDRDAAATALKRLGRAASSAIEASASRAKVGSELRRIRGVRWEFPHLPGGDGWGPEAWEKLLCAPLLVLVDTEKGEARALVDPPMGGWFAEELGVIYDRWTEESLGGGRIIRCIPPE